MSVLPRDVFWLPLKRIQLGSSRLFRQLGDVLGRVNVHPADVVFIDSSGGGSIVLKV
jgi:hypothetical protein